MTLEEAQQQLGSLHEPLVACIDDAWERWRSLVDPAESYPNNPEAQAALRALRVDHVGATARANLMHDWIVGAFVGRIPTLPLRVHAFPHNTTLLFSVQDIAVLRFKKMTRDGVTSNYPTNNSLNYDAQVPIAGLPPLPRLDVGYVLSDDGEHLVLHMLAKPAGQIVEWAYDISTALPVFGNPTLPFVPPLAPQPVRRRFHPPVVVPSREDAQDDV